jgi:hypothetical protein
MYRSPRAAGRSFVAAATMAATLAVGMAIPTAATNDSGPAYSADVIPGSVAVGTGTSTQITITVTQVSHAHEKAVDSIRITPPEGVHLTSGSAVRGSHTRTVTITAGVATVDHVGLDHDEGEIAPETAVITLEADIPCGVAGDEDWTVEAQHDHDYDDDDPSLSIDGDSDLTSHFDRCTFEFADQPQSAAVDTIITTQEADPAGPPITLQLLDGNGDDAAQDGVGVSVAIASGTGTSGATVGGTTSDTTNSAGIARVRPTIDRAGTGYRLEATATTSGVGSPVSDSDAFDINDVAVVCSGDCSGNSHVDDTWATVSAESTGILTFSLGVDSLDCNNSANLYYKGTSQVLTFDVTGSSGRTTVTMRLAKGSATRNLSRYEVCFSSPASRFVNKYGRTIAAGKAGLLPRCIWRPRHPSGGPCLVSRARDEDGNVLVTFSVPAGDPRGKI